jgi:hypothetical protein
VHELDCITKNSQVMSINRTLVLHVSYLHYFDKVYMFSSMVSVLGYPPDLCRCDVSKQHDL